MLKRICLLAGFAALSMTSIGQAEPLILNEETSFCDLFEALNGPEKLPAHCRRADCPPGQCKSRLRPPSVAAPDRAILPDINFGYASDMLSPEARRELDKVVVVMTDPSSAGERYRVEGNTDRKGSDAYNRKLSLRRAQAVKRYLVQQGVEPEQLRAIGNGYHKLLDPHHPYDSINRRVEFINQSRRSQ